MKNVALALLFAALVPALAADTARGATTAPTVACDKPVYLVVWIENLDRSKSRAYGEALRASKIVSRHGGEYKAVGPPVVMLEGNWPADRGFVVEQYPCLEAIKTMWYSQEYQKKLVPLRAGSGDYTVAVFDAYRPSRQR